MTYAIQTEGLTKRFRHIASWRQLLSAPFREPDRLAVDDISLQVPSGRVYGLLGRNGAGKTTLVRMLSTLLLPTSGRAAVAGVDVVADPRTVRARIGLVSGDERSFYWRLTGRQNLEFFATLAHVPRRIAAQRIAGLADRLELGDTLDRPFGRLSSGQRQRIAIARGLLNEPEVLFMDEPTRSLDPIAAVAIRDFVAEYVVGDLGRTVLLATHSMPEAEALCSRMAFIQAGRIVAEGTVASLRREIGYGIRCELGLRDARPGGAARALAAIGALTGVRSLGGQQGPADPGTWLTELALVDEERLAEVLRVAIEVGAAVVACRTREPSLEEIYVRTLGDRDVDEMVLAGSAA